MLPILPPLTNAELPGCGGRQGPELEDFCVDELPLYDFSGEGEHRYVRLEKRGKTTQQLLTAVARAAGVRPRDVGSAGMKDKYAVTTQWVSFLDRGTTPAEDWELEPEYRVLESTRHNNKLRTGHLKGNRFTLRLVELERADSSVVNDLVQALKERGLHNYFGSQRFGRDGGNLDSAQAWLAQEKPNRKARFENKLYPSVLQSEVFNRYLTSRVALGLGQLIEGEVVRLEGSGSMFVVEDLPKEQKRFEERDLWLTGPMPGPKMRPAAGAAFALEEQALKSLELDTAALERLARWAPGTRRDLVVTPGDLECEIQPEGAAILRFSLPAGSYATQLVREFCR